MRVGFVVYGSLDLISGGFLYDRLLVAALRARNVEVEVIALPWRRHARAILDNVAAWPAALRRCDVVVEDELVHPSVFARHGGLRASGIPVVALVHNLGCRPDDVRHPVRRAIERRYFGQIDGAIAVCEATRADVARLADRALPTVVARAGRDHLEAVSLQEQARSAGPLRLLFVGAVMPHKGLPRLLRALRPLRGLPWSLTVVGNLAADARHVARLRAQSSRAGLSEKIRWAGELAGEALWDAYRAADLLVLPSDREAYSLACLEAMAFRLPVMVTNRGGMRELVNATPGPKQSGWLLDPDDIPAWTAALEVAARDGSLRLSLGQAARRRFLEHGTWRETADVVLEFLERVRARVGRSARQA